MNIFTKVTKIRQEAREKARAKQEQKLLKLRRQKEEALKDNVIHVAIADEKAALKGLKRRNPLFQGLKSGVREAMRRSQDGEALLTRRKIGESERNIHEGVGRNIWDDPPGKSAWDDDNKKRKTIWD